MISTSFVVPFAAAPVLSTSTAARMVLILGPRRYHIGRTCRGPRPTARARARGGGLIDGCILLDFIIIHFPLERKYDFNLLAKYLTVDVLMASFILGQWLGLSARWRDRIDLRHHGLGSRRI